MWPIIGKNFDPEGFKQYVAGLDLPNAAPWIQFLVLHNTGEPTLAQRPHGFNYQHMLDLQDFYQHEQGWSGGPALFIDDNPAGIWVFNPLTEPGVHSPSWNHVSQGIEMLGDFDSEDFSSGRGLAVQQNAVAAIAILSAALGLDPTTMRLHKEDPGTTHRTCPGASVDKDSFIQAVQAYGKTL